MTGLRRSRPIATVLFALCLVACKGQPSEPPSSAAGLISVPTQSPWPGGVPQSCMTALLTGVLVADERWGLAIDVGEAEVQKVSWPFGFAARADGDGLVLVDTTHGGAIVAREGDRVQIGGGDTGRDNGWIACGGPTVIAPS